MSSLGSPDRRQMNAIVSDRLELVSPFPEFRVEVLWRPVVELDENGFLVEASQRFERLDQRLRRPERSHVERLLESVNRCIRPFDRLFAPLGLHGTRNECWRYDRSPERVRSARANMFGDDYPSRAPRGER